MQDIGEKERNSMRKKIKYTDEPLGKLEIIEDFLPTPNDLVFKEDEVSVTLRLRKSSMDFYRRLAKTHKSRHDKVIRRLLDQYASTYDSKM